MTDATLEHGAGHRSGHGSGHGAQRGASTAPALEKRAPGAVARDSEQASAAAQPNRLSTSAAQQALINRNDTLRFTWDGQPMTGHPGDTLSSALLANGVKVLARSFKYHRPRGVMSAGVEEGGAIVAVGENARRTPNVNASVEPLYNGLVAEGQNAWPSVRWDLGAVNNLLSPFLGAGFYYKTFFSFTPKTPTGTGHWMVFERFIRKAAGMGRASRAPDPDAYETAHAHCDLLVVGSGPAGLEAARAAAEAGLDVLLAEQDFELGGQTLADRAPIEGLAPEVWRAQALDRLKAAGVRILPRTTVFGLYDGGVAGMVEKVSLGPPKPRHVRERFWIVRADKTVLATGAMERGLAFGENDRPGVMTAGALQTYVNRFGVAPGRRVMLATTHDGARGAASQLAAAGLEVTLLDARDGTPVPIEGVVVKGGAAPLRALTGNPTAGVTGVELAQDTTLGWRATDRLDCDLIAVSGGWSPVVNLLSHRGVKPVWDPEKLCFRPGETSEPIETCGAAAGLASPDACAASGRNAVARLLGRAEETPPVAAAVTPPRPLYEVKVPGRKEKSFVDPQHDVTAEDVRLAHREGYVSVEHLKRYTTMGMATDQGKNGNIIGLALMAEAQGLDIPDVGTTTFRPPYTPVSIGALGGRARGAHYKPERRTPMHRWNQSKGAEMTDAGLWKRPWYYPRAGETMDQAYIREATVVRESIGICDVTTLGKIAIQGPDAAEFLNRIYVNGFAKLPIGKARYGVMLRDDGAVFDDGTTWRMGEHDFFMTTTTAGAGKVMSWLEELAQVRWPELRVALTSVSERWAGFAVAGPQARNLLRALAEDVDFSDEAFPFMGVREGVLGRGDGAALCRIARLSFSGEMAYEIYVESDHGEALAAALWDGVDALGGALYGTEALGALRIEKGHVAGAELDGRTTLADLGLGGMASKKKPFIGQVLASRDAMAAPYRQTLVGLVPVDREETFKAGAILCAQGAVEGHGVGWISAVTHSPALGHWIGLGLLEGGLPAWTGKRLIAADPVRGKETVVEVVSPHFVDPKGERMKPAVDPAPSGAIRPGPSVYHRRSALGAQWTEAGDGARSRSVLGRQALAHPESPEGDPGDWPVWLVEAKPRPVWQFTAWPDRQAAALARIAEIAGVAAPAMASSTTSKAGVDILHVAPLTWRLVGVDRAQSEALEATDSDIGAALSLEHADLCVVVGGREAKTLLNRCLPLDLRDGSFPKGKVATSAFHHTPVILHRFADAAYRLWLPRSYAHSLWGLLVENAHQWSAEERA